MPDRGCHDCNPRTQNPGETRKGKTGSPKKMECTLMLFVGFGNVFRIKTTDQAEFQDWIGRPRSCARSQSWCY